MLLCVSSSRIKTLMYFTRDCIKASKVYDVEKSLKEEKLKEDPPKQEPPKQKEVPKEEPAKLKEEFPKQELTKQEIPKQEPPKANSLMYLQIAFFIESLPTCLTFIWCFS